MTENNQNFKFVLRIAIEERADEVFKFHTNNVGEFLFPRTLDQIRKLIESESVYEVLNSETNEIVAASYLKAESGEDEFGGVFVAKGYRGLGIPQALGKFAIINNAVFAASKNKLIAHVHIDNKDPLDLLQNDLGFYQTGEVVKIPSEIAPTSMRRNANGEVEGLCFDFQRKTFNDFADWLKKFNGTISGKKKKISTLKVELRIMAHIDDVIVALNDLAKK